MLMQKSLAFIEFETVEQAKQAVMVSNADNVLIRTNKGIFAFSGREQITKDEEGSRILLVTITNIKYPINVEILRTIFSKHGKVEKVIIF